MSICNETEFCHQFLPEAQMFTYVLIPYGKSYANDSSLTFLVIAGIVFSAIVIIVLIIILIIRIKIDKQLQNETSRKNSSEYEGEYFMSDEMTDLYRDFSGVQMEEGDEFDPNENL